MTDQTTTIADLALSQSAFLVSQAVVELDAMFGEGYAAAHPAVLAQFLQTAGSSSPHSCRLLPRSTLPRSSTA